MVVSVSRTLLTSSGQLILPFPFRSALTVSAKLQVYKLSIGAACALTWPPDRIIIQVLDDSTDPMIKVTRLPPISITVYMILQHSWALSATKVSIWSGIKWCSWTFPSLISNQNRKGKHLLSNLDLSSSCCWRCIPVGTLPRLEWEHLVMAWDPSLKLQF